MDNLNSYNETNFKEKFLSTPIGQRLIKDYDIISWDYNSGYDKIYTEREKFAKSIFSAVPFYYLEKLTEKNPKEIYDLGCGWNIFKKYITNIIGIGAEDLESGCFYGDLHDFVDDDFIKGHNEFFESVFSINAMHFVPLENLGNRIQDFISMIKPEGRGFLTLNLARLVERSSKQFLTATFGSETPTSYDYEKYVRQIISTIRCKFLVIDIDCSQMDNFMDGNIRLVIEK